MRKWKSPARATSSKIFEQNITSSWESPDSEPMPNFNDLNEGENELNKDGAEGAGVEASNTGIDSSFDTSLVGAKREVEWVDWLDEYRRMKEAKVRAEQAVSSRNLPHHSHSLPDRSKGPSLRELVNFPTVPTSSDHSLAFICIETPKRATTLAPTSLEQSRADFWPLDLTVSGLSASRPKGPLLSSTDISPTSAAPPLPRQASDELSRRSIASSTDISTSLLGTSPGLKRRRNFKLGSKIDAWWSAVRTSFSVTSEEDRSRARKDSTGSSPSSGLSNFTSHTSAHAALPRSSRPPLRTTSSASNLLVIPVTSAPIPAGASATSDFTTTRTSTSPHEGTPKWRNPNLTLSLPNSFDPMRRHSSSPQGQQNTKGDQFFPDETTSIQRTRSQETRNQLAASHDFATTSTALYTPVQPSSASAAAPSLPNRIPGFDAASGFTPPATRSQDSPPTLVPTSQVFPVIERPKATREDDKSAVWSPSLSMNVVQQHIHLRLATAKENCDKELVKIVSGITAHVEMELSTDSPLLPVNDGNFGELVGDDESFATFDMDSESEVAIDFDGTESEGIKWTDRPSSRSQSINSPAPEVPLELSRKGSQGRVRSHSGRRLSSAVRPRPRHTTSGSRQGDLLVAEGRRSSHSQTRTNTGTVSATSSRSTSRSRSPLPLPHSVSSLALGARSPARSSTSQVPLPLDLAQSAFIALLQDIIMVATEILDTSISTITSRPGYCAEYIQRTQLIGKAWDDNPELPCRGWYVQLLLAVAGLSRVVEWWEAEKGFWMFEDTDDEGIDEPIVFVAKPADDETSIPLYSLPVSPKMTDLVTSPLDIALGIQYDYIDALSLSPPMDAGDAKRRDADDLRLTVEQVRSQTLLMELSLDGQLFQYLSSAWEDLVGWVAHFPLFASQY